MNSNIFTKAITLGGLLTGAILAAYYFKKNGFNPDKMKFQVDDLKESARALRKKVLKISNESLEQGKAKLNI